MPRRPHELAPGPSQSLHAQALNKQEAPLQLKSPPAETDTGHPMTSRRSDRRAATVPRCFAGGPGPGRRTATPGRAVSPAAGEPGRRPSHRVSTPCCATGKVRRIVASATKPGGDRYIDRGRGKRHKGRRRGREGEREREGEKQRQRGQYSGYPHESIHSEWRPLS